MASNAARIEVADKIRDHYKKMQSQGQRSLGGYRYQIRNEIDGVKVDFVDNSGKSVGWLAVRPSGTSPEIVVAINSLESEDVLSMIKNDFFGQMALHKDMISMNKLEPEIYIKQSKDFVEGRRLPSAVEAVRTAPAKPSRATPGTYAASAALELPDEIDSWIAAERAECAKTIESVQSKRATGTNLRGGVVIIAIDNALYTGVANSALNGIRELAQEHFEDTGVMLVRGDSKTLNDEIAKAITAAQAKGMTVLNVVTQLNAKTYAAVKDNKDLLEKLGYVLSINTSAGETLPKNKAPYIQMIRLFDLSLKIAYRSRAEDDEGIRQTLSRILAKDVAMENVAQMLAKKILEILPAIKAIDSSDAVNTYNAIRTVFASL